MKTHESGMRNSNYKRKSSHGKVRKLRVRVATWNVGGESPPSDLDDLLGFNSEEFPDMIFVGLQENSAGFLSGDEWSKTIKRIMKARGYSKIGDRYNTQICLYFYVRNELAKKIEDAEVNDIHGVDITQLWKGGVRVKFTLAGRSYQFINCHLPAHDGQYSKRIELAYKITQESDTANYNFVTGDMNFRLEEESSPEEVAEAIYAGNYLNFLNKDELKKAMKEYEAFVGYSELPIDFKPTFKYHKGTDKYNTKRRPAWTDRVLYKVGEGSRGEIKGLTYQRVESLKISDHRPVFAEFRVKM